VKIRGVVFQTRDEQFVGGDDRPVDVGGIEWPKEGVPIRTDFTVALGWTTKLWVEEDRLMFEGEIHVMPPDDHWIPCAGTSIGRVTKDRGIESGELLTIGLCTANANKNHPPATLIK